jgi:peptidoglycan hydrolase CwlO-like protein
LNNKTAQINKWRRKVDKLKEKLSDVDKTRNESKASLDEIQNQLGQYEESIEKLNAKIKSETETYTVIFNGFSNDYRYLLTFVICLL